MNQRCMRRRQKNGRGQTLVEFALIFPLLVLILMGIFDFGRAFYAYSVVANAAREGARTGVIATATDLEIRQAVKDLAGAIDIADEDITITPAGSRTSGESITVQVDYYFSAVTPLINNFFPGGSLELSSSATMYVE